MASNTDLTIPTAFGVAPGHGVLVETVRRFSGVDPVVAGKPARPLLDETVRRCGGRAAADGRATGSTPTSTGRTHAGVDSLLVLTGVTGLAELVAARPEERPTYVARDLGGLAEAHPAPEPGRRRGGAGRLDRRGCPTAGCGSTGAGGPRRLVAAWSRWRPGDTSTRPASPSTTSGVQPPE